jgi:hypothetical protein
MKTQVVKAALLVIMLISVSGCGTSFFSTRQTNPVVAEYLGVWPFPGAVGVLSPDASRRITIIRMDDADKDYSDKKWQIGEFCAEPPPDAMVNTASQFAQALAAKIKVPDPQGGGVAAEGSGQEQFVQQIASAMSPLLRRSQGLQWARDNLSFVCNAHLNRVISKADYLLLVKDIIERSDKLISAEMTHLPVFEWKITGAPVGAPTLSPPPSLPNLP